MYCKFKFKPCLRPVTYDTGTVYPTHHRRGLKKVKKKADLRFVAYCMLKDDFKFLYEYSNTGCNEWIMDIKKFLCIRDEKIRLKTLIFINDK
jgi:hypothetical protein